MSSLLRPAALTRDGITLAVEQVVVYPDQVELLYTLRDLPHEALFDPFLNDPQLSCGSPDSYPGLVLPDGTAIAAVNYMLDGKVFGVIESSASSYMIHLFQATIPADVQQLTMTLHCLALARLDTAPLDWEIPFQIAVPQN